MPLDVPGCTRATMIIAVSISFYYSHRMRETIYSLFASVLNVYLCAR
eukprot:UN08763